MNIENDMVSLVWIVGSMAGVWALIYVAGFYGLPFFPFVLTLPAWLVGWYLVCWGVDVALRRGT